MIVVVNHKSPHLRNRLFSFKNENGYVTMVARNDIQWMASDEGVLANSLGFDSFTREMMLVFAHRNRLKREGKMFRKAPSPSAV